MTNDEWRMANGEWRMANGEWRMANGEWRMANGEWRMGRVGGGGRRRSAQSPGRSTICIDILFFVRICQDRSMTPIHQELRAKRLESGLSQKELGSRLGMPQSHVSAIEAGKV